MKSVAVIGEICLDIIMHNPNSVEVRGEKMWAEDIITTIGGSAALTAAALSSLGEPVKIYGSIGDDDAGKMILRMLRKSKVDCESIAILPGEKTTHSMVICKKEEKNFLGCSRMLPLAIPPEKTLDDTKLVYIAGFTLYQEFWTDECLAYIERACRMGIPIVTDGQCTGFDAVDSNPNQYMPLFKIMSLSTVFLAAQKELLYLERSPDGSREAGQMLRTGLNTAVIKRGRNGAAAFDRNGMYEAPGYPVDVYDAVGSGDIFGAAYSYGLINRWPVQKCIDFACVFSAGSLLKYDGQKRHPSKEWVLNIINNRG